MVTKKGEDIQIAKRNLRDLPIPGVRDSIEMEIEKTVNDIKKRLTRIEKKIDVMQKCITSLQIKNNISPFLGRLLERRLETLELLNGLKIIENE